jgi:hypothetical protein
MVRQAGIHLFFGPPGGPTPKRFKKILKNRKNMFDTPCGWLYITASRQRCASQKCRLFAEIQADLVLTADRLCSSMKTINVSMTGWV